jgi:hypothetical protein
MNTIATIIGYAAMLSGGVALTAWAAIVAYAYARERWLVYRKIRAVFVDFAREQARQREFAESSYHPPIDEE